MLNTFCKVGMLGTEREITLSFLQPFNLIVKKADYSSCIFSLHLKQYKCISYIIYTHLLMVACQHYHVLKDLEVSIWYMQAAFRVKVMKIPLNTTEKKEGSEALQAV